MKSLRFFLILLFAASVSFVACDKDFSTSTESFQELVNDDEEILEDGNSFDVDWDAELEDRSATITEVKLTGNNQDGKLTGTGCFNSKWVGNALLTRGANNINFEITGTNLIPALPAGAVVSNYYTLDAGNITLTSPKAGVGSRSTKVYAILKQTGKDGFVDTLQTNDDINGGELHPTTVTGQFSVPNNTSRNYKRFSLKIVYEIPRLKKDSTFSTNLKKSKTIYVLPYIEEDAFFGTLAYDRLKLVNKGNGEFLKPGFTAINSALLSPRSGSAQAIDSTYVPAVGDVLTNTAGDVKGIIYGVKAKVGNVIDVDIHRRDCANSSLKRSTWKFYTNTTRIGSTTVQPGFRVKSDGIAWTQYGGTPLLY